MGMSSQTMKKIGILRNVLTDELKRLSETVCYRDTYKRNFNDGRVSGIKLAIDGLDENFYGSGDDDEMKDIENELQQFKTMLINMKNKHEEHMILSSKNNQPVKSYISLGKFKAYDDILCKFNDKFKLNEDLEECVMCESTYRVFKFKVNGALRLMCNDCGLG